MRRRGVTLVELLVVVGLLAVLIGLLLPAVQRVRQAAIRAQSSNQLRQLSVGLQHYCSAHDGRLPYSPVPDVVINPSYRTADSPILGPVAYVEGGEAYYRVLELPRDQFPRDWQWVRLLWSAADPTTKVLTLDKHAGYTVSSYSANIRLFLGRPTLSGSVPDGTSSTLAYVERYCLVGPNLGTNLGLGPKSSLYVASDWPPEYFDPSAGPRRATFADKGWADVVPVTAGSPPVTRPSQPGITFAAGVPPEQASPYHPASPHPTGLLTAFADGGVRFLRAGLAEQAFWGMVTRDGGEVVSE